MQIGIGGDDIAGIEHGVLSGEVGDDGARFLRDEDAGADVPRFQPHFKEGIDAVGGDETQIERGRTETAHIGDFLQYGL